MLDYLSHLGYHWNCLLSVCPYSPTLCLDVACIGYGNIMNEFDVVHAVTVIL